MNRMLSGVRRRELRGAEKRTKGCGEEKTLYFGATVGVHEYTNDGEKE